MPVCFFISVIARLSSSLIFLEYICPKCGHFNPSQRSLKSGNPTSPPTSPGSEPQRRRTGPRKSEPAGPLNTAVASGFDRRKSLPSPQISSEINADGEQPPPVPPLPAQFAQQGRANFSSDGDRSSEDDGPKEQHYEMEVDS